MLRKPKSIQDYWKHQAQVVRYFTPASESGPTVTESSILDIDRRVLVQQRTGTSGGATNVSQYFYNTAGSLVLHTNLLSGITRYSEVLVSGSSQRTTSYPDQGVKMKSYYVDGRLKSVTGSAAVAVMYERDVESVTDHADTAWREYMKQTCLNASGAPTLEWVKTYFEAAGRAYRTVYPARPVDLAGNPERRAYYNVRGQLWKEIDSDGITTLTGYNVKGEAECIAQAADHRSAFVGSETSVDPIFGNYAYVNSSVDRISRTIREIGTVTDTSTGQSTSVPVNRTKSLVWDGAQWITASMEEVSTDGLKSWSTVNRDEASGGSVPISTRMTISYPGSPSWGRGGTVTMADGSQTATLYSYGLLGSTLQKDANGQTIGRVNYSYSNDPYMRLWASTDLQNGKSTLVYNLADQPTIVVAPPAGDGSLLQSTIIAYDHMGRVTGNTYADQSVVNFRYWPNGKLRHTWGSRTYPVGYLYDPQARMTTMATWRTFPGAQNFLTDPSPNLTGAALTGWSYNLQRGWAEKKTHADGNVQQFLFTAAGRPTVRQAARQKAVNTPVTTTYKYDFQYASGS